MNARTLVEMLEILPPSQAVLIQGDTGVGKSDIVRQFAASINLPLVDVRASTMSEGDMGYPDIKAIETLGMTVFTLPAWYMRACKEPVVLFLDEWNRGLIGVLNGMMQITLDREFGNDKQGLPVRLHPETRVIAAVNVGPDFAVSSMDRAHRNRFWIADFTPDRDDWIKWATTKGDVDPIIVDFIRMNEKFLRQDVPGDGTHQEPTQRSWDKFNKALKYRKFTITDGGLPSWFYNLAGGFVGAPTAQALMSFISNYNFLLSASDILDKWSNEISGKVKKLDPEGRLALIEKISNNCRDTTWTVDQAKNLYSMWSILTGEEKMALFNGIQNTKNAKNASTFHSFVKSEILDLVNKAHNLSTKK